MTELTHTPLPMKIYNQLWGEICRLRQRLKELTHRRNRRGDKIIIEDEVLVWEGSAEDVKAGRAKLKFWSKGHIVDLGLMTIINLASASGTTGSTEYTTYPANGWYMYVGTGSGTTAHGTTALVSPVTTKPSSQSGATSNPSAGQWRISWTGTWNAGALSAITVSEIGLYLNYFTNETTLAGFGATPSSQTVSQFLFSRLSVSDGDFSSFTVNTSVPLTIQWNLTLTFA